MEYQDFLPSVYQDAIEMLDEYMTNESTIVEKKQMFALFCRKFTVLPHLWIQRIQLETLEVPFSTDVYYSCLDLENYAMKHFYHPKYVFEFPYQKFETHKIMNMGNYNFCYRLPEPESVSSYCNSSVKDIYHMLFYERLEKFLTFPHSQLRKFYRYHQLHSPTPLSKIIQQKYETSIKSYDYMVTIAMDSEKWLEWMKENFHESFWIRNLEAKLSEHWFMHDMWMFYIDLLDSKNDIEVLNIYQRYCRFYIRDKSMQEKYAATTLKYLKLGQNVLKWLFDQAKFEYDFESRELGILQLKALLKKYEICEECFDEINQLYFKKELESEKDESCFDIFWSWKEKAKKNCCLCLDNSLMKDSDSKLMKRLKQSMFLYDDKSEREKYFESLRFSKSLLARNYKPIVKLQFHDSLQPPIPVSVLNYIIENADHTILSKLYQTCKYFFIKKLILICHQLYVSKSFAETFIKNSCATNFSTLMNHRFIEKFCCKVLIFHDWETQNYLSKSLSNICCCSLKCIRIGGQNLMMEEFLKIIGGGKLEQVRLRNVRIFKDNGENLVIEEIVELLPSVVDLALNSNPIEAYTPNTAHNLAALERSEKFESFGLDEIPENFMFFEFYTFLMENMIPRANVTLKLRDDVGEDFEEEFKQFCSDVKLDWDPIYEAPQIH